MAEEYLDVAIPRFKANEDRLNEFVNGDDTTSFPTSDGTRVSSISKFLKELRNSFTDEAIAAGVAAGVGEIGDQIREATEFFQGFVDSKGDPNGVAGLGPDGKVPVGQLPEGVGAKVPVVYDKTDGRNPARLFAKDSVAPDAFAYRLTTVASPYNPNYEGGNYIAQHVRHVAEGTNKNGPRGAALGQAISMFKEGFGTGTAKGGEIDALYITLRQDSPRDNSPGINDPNRGDGCGILIDAAVHQNVGFVGGIEGATSVLSNVNGAVTRSLVYQIGCTDTTTASSIGLFTSAAKGSHSAGLLVYGAEGSGGSFDNYIQCRTDTVGIFNIDRGGTVSMGRRLNSGQMIDLCMHIAVQADYSLAWLNADKSVGLLSLDQNGNLSAYGGMSASAINSRSNVQAQGNIIAGGKVSATLLRLTPGNAGSQASEYVAGTFSVGQSGRPRFCLADGQAPVFLATTTA